MTIMKNILALFLIATMVTLGLTSCEKNDYFPLSLTVIETGGDNEEELRFSSKKVYKHSDIEGQSWFVAHTDGRKANDLIMLSIYFDDITSISECSDLTPTKVMFSLIYSSNSRNSTNSFTGSISLVSFNKYSAVLRWKDVCFNIAAGEFHINGDMKCDLHERYRQ